MDLFRDKDIFLIGGPGGVGKTTLAAALGVQFAKAGYKTIVLTVDPAKRLAQALGFDKFHNEVQQVAIPGDADHILYASMLDTQRYFDKVIDRFSKNKEQRDKIIGHPIYRTMVEHLGGTNEYAAMEKLLEFVQKREFEKIIVDTPPSQNAVDLLGAPKRLADFMDNSVLRWFQGRKPLYLQIFQSGTRLAMKLLQRIFGNEFLESFANLLDTFDGMQAGFRKRHLQVLELLKGPKTAFLLVTRPTEARYTESTYFLEALKEHEIPLGALILNQLEPYCPAQLPDAFWDKQKAQVPNLDHFNALLSYYHSLHAQEGYWIDRFKTLIEEHPSFLIPRFQDDLQQLEALSQLGSCLLNLKDESTKSAQQTTQTQ